MPGRCADPRGLDQDPCLENAHAWCKVLSMHADPSPSAQWARPLLGFAALWALQRTAQVAAFGWGDPNDLVVYERYARAWSEGEAPYLDFHPEYPPGALLLFRAPFAIAGGGAHFAAAFGLEMALFEFGLLCALCAWWKLHRLEFSRGGSIGLAAAAYLLSTLSLNCVLYTRFDLAVVALTMAALYLTY